MKWRILILLLLVYQTSTHAAHIAGGELYYRYVGSGPNGTDIYELTMRLFRECSSNGPQLANEIVNVGAYSGSSNILVSSVVLGLVGSIQQIQLQQNSIPCLVGSPDVCYEVAIYTNLIELPRTTDGYTLAWARCCRANGLMSASGQIGATYIARIPGTIVLPTGSNSSPQFVVKDTALVCGDNDFILDFGAFDMDGDSLSYEFCEAYIGGSSVNQNAPPPGVLNLQPLSYNAGFSGAQPLGADVIIDPRTGMISGIAPDAPGRYVVSVCVTEWRNGQPINQHRKDFILKVGDCNIIAAKLKDQYINCDSFTTSFQNETNSSQVRSYFWDFGVVGNADTSNTAQPSFTFPDTGVYQIKLVINRNEECSDTATSYVRIFPGFEPMFNFNGSCYLNPFNFTDASAATYGFINSWRWDFGVTNIQNDTSIIQHPTYQYNSVGTRNVKLTVTSNKGCIGSHEAIANVTDKPYLHLPFRDTLICSVDSLMLQAEGSGVFSWTGNNIINTNTANPVVFPKDTMVYVVQLTDNTCVATDSIRVNVLDSVTINLATDTAICKTDSISLQLMSHALAYAWSPSEGLNSSDVKQPFASPANTIKYHVTATLGKCFAKDSIEVRVSPYPVSMAGTDTTICFGDKVQLNGATISNGFNWSPDINVINANELNAIAAPSSTTAYILTAIGNEECPKSIYDTVIITVIPPVKAFAGNDTTVTGAEPLLLTATGGIKYSWSPAIYMDDPAIASPTILLSNDIDEMLYRVTVTTDDGCKGEDEIKIVVFKTGPQIFVPDAFTPNNDGINDLLYPVIVGMKQLNFFRVYNRLGQLVFSTSQQGKGWNGRIGGKEQAPGTYVYMAQAINYKGEVISKKGTVLLIK